ncbi:MAG: alginate export family protein [Planctomycetia bacterium]|nr:alginate export family protein [Planctomycetia bacterium]
MVRAERKRVVLDRTWRLLFVVAGAALAASAALPATAPAADADQAPSLVETSVVGAAEAETTSGSSEAAATSQKPVPAKPPPSPWKGVFYDNDFSLVFDPEHTPVWGESFKELGIGEACLFTFSVGGELRCRFMDDTNRFRPEYPAHNDYDLWRWRNYLDLAYDDQARLYVELIDASAFHEELPPLAVDVDRWDLLNAFVDLNVADVLGQDVWFRFGRQELLYGAERLISPPDWTNTRRTFEGFKAFTRGPAWDVDAFAVRPVVVFPESFDQGDASRTFSGVYAVYHEQKDATLDVYWLWDREQLPLANRADGSRHTVGSRLLRRLPVRCGCGDDAKVVRLWELELEGAYQFGHDNGETVRAGFLTAGVGHTWSARPWQPNLWCYFDWASGDRQPGDGQTNTFNQLFPLTHKYLGYFDGVSRQNIIDYNIRATVKPHKKLTLLAWMHFFELADPDDAFYNVAGAPFARNAAGNRFTDVGQELDLTLLWSANSNIDVLVGASWFWNGDMLVNAVESRTEDGRVFYAQTVLRY